MANWQYDDDFGWYDADAPLTPVPGPTVIPGTWPHGHTRPELAMNPAMVNAALSNLDLRNVGGTYHPDVVMPQPLITSENIQRGYMPTAINQDTAIFLNALNALATGRDPTVPMGVPGGTLVSPTPPPPEPDPEPPAEEPTEEPEPEPTPPPLDAQGLKEQNWRNLYGEPGSVDAERNFEDMNFTILQRLLGDPTFTAFYPIASQVYEMRISRGTGDVPWREITGNLERRILQRILQGGYDTSSPGYQYTGDYGALSTFFKDVQGFLAENDVDTSDISVYAMMDKFVENATGEFQRNRPGTTDIPLFASRYNINLADWKAEGRPLRPGGASTVTDIPTFRDPAELGAGVGDPLETSGPGLTTDPTGTTTDAPPPGFTAAEWASLTPDQKANFAAEFPGLTTDPTGTAVTPTAFTGGEFGAGTAGPATAGIFAGMQPQEDFKQDVFRRFLAEQVSPQTGQLQPLSPFMMRGAQNLYPQLLGEYSTAVYDPANWTDAGNQMTFGDWLRAGERPTRQGMFNTLGDISNVIAAGQQGITAPGISLGESLRRQNIMNQFGTETADSRQALQSLFSTAALRGVAPSFRYPVQSAAQGLFETQRALQPEKSFLSFLSERL